MYFGYFFKIIFSSFVCPLQVDLEASYYILLVIGGNEARPQYLQYGAPQQKRQQQQHILESRLTVFSHSRTLVVPGIFLKVLYNIHHHIAFARELEEKEKNTEHDQPAVRFIFHLVVEVYSRGNRTPEDEKKQTSVYLIKRKMKKKKIG